MSDRLERNENFFFENFKFIVSKIEKRPDLFSMIDLQYKAVIT